MVIFKNRQKLLVLVIYLAGIAIRKEIAVDFLEFFYRQMSAGAVFQKSFIPFLNFSVYQINRHIMFVSKMHVNYTNILYHWWTYLWIRYSVSNPLKPLALVYYFVYPFLFILFFPFKLFASRMSFFVIF